MPAEFIRVGQIVGAFGLKGEVKVEPMTDFVDRFKRGTRLRLNGEWITVESSREHKGRPLVKLEGINDMSAAEKLQWQYLEAASKKGLELDEDEYLFDDLIGLRVVTTNGEDLGEVEDVLPYPAHDVLEVGELMIPMVDQFIKRIDLENKQITVDLLPGMTSEEE